jgi:superfamily I DNA and/or RNA helicase
LPSNGAGLEIDLASVRQGDRVPEELRPLLPGRGVVNLPEARAVVRKVEELLCQPGEKAADTIAVMALYPAQVELIRRLIGQSPQLARQASIAVGLPAAFLQREADVVVVGLTRSHANRAVAYGEGPAVLELALTRARRRLVVVGDPGNLVRRSQWRGALDCLDETAANQEALLLGRLVRYLQLGGRH